MRYVVNVENGNVLFRSHATDRYPLLFRQIDDNMAKMISEGKITGKQIADAALKKDMSQPGFDYSEYDKRRQAEKKARCMSSRDMTPVTEAPIDVTEEAKPEATLTLSDIGARADAQDKPTTKTEAQEKATKAKSSKDKDAGEY